MCWGRTLLIYSVTNQLQGIQSQGDHEPAPGTALPGVAARAGVAPSDPSSSSSPYPWLQPELPTTSPAYDTMAKDASVLVWWDEDKRTARLNPPA